jgi:hypothetical protein
MSITLARHSATFLQKKQQDGTFAGLHMPAGRFVLAITSGREHRRFPRQRPVTPGMTKSLGTGTKIGPPRGGDFLSRN